MRRTRSRRKIAGSGQIEEMFWSKRQGSLSGFGVDPKTGPWRLGGLRKPLGGLRAQSGGPGAGGPQGPRPARGALTVRRRVRPGKSGLPRRARRARTRAPGPEQPAVEPWELPALPPQDCTGSPHTRPPVRRSAWESGELGDPCPYPTCPGTPLAY